MPDLFPFVRCLVPLCLAAALLWAGTGRPAQAAGDATLVLNACGAFMRQPGLSEPWPGGKAVRLGQTLLPGDKGLGCRFTLTGEPAGAAVVVTVRLTRPGPDGAPVDDHWFVPVRRGEAAAAVYGFAPGQPAPAGPWSLTLTADGAGTVTARFDAPAPVGEPGAAGLAAPAPPLPAPVTVQAVTPVSPPLVGEATAPTVAAPDAAAIASDPATGLPTSAARSAEAPLASPAATAMPPAIPAAAAKAQPAAAGTAKPRAPPTAKAPAPATAKPTASSPPQSVAQATAKPAAPAGYVALQTGLFADAGNAALQAAKLRARGMPACVAVTGTGAKQRYRVLAGRFGDKRAAGEARAAVAAILGLSPLVYAVDAAEVPRLRCR